MIEYEYGKLEILGVGKAKVWVFLVAMVNNITNHTVNEQTISEAEKLRV
jgi:hypothetical protein